MSLMTINERYRRGYSNGSDVPFSFAMYLRFLVVCYGKKQLIIDLFVTAW